MWVHYWGGKGYVALPPLKFFLRQWQVRFQFSGSNSAIFILSCLLIEVKFYSKNTPEEADVLTFLKGFRETLN